MKTYTFYRNGQEYKTSNLAEFCKENKLMRRHMQEVAYGERKSYKGWTKKPTPFDAAQPPETTVDEALNGARRMAEAMQEEGDQSHNWAVMIDKVNQIAAGEPIEIPAEDYDRLLNTEHESLMEMVNNGLIKRAK